MSLDSTQLRYFLEVGTLGSIKGAAETLHITQSALSRRMAKLEHDIGRPLFERSHEGVTLTPTGRQLMGHAIELIALLDRIRRIGDGPEEPAEDFHSLRLGMVSSISSLLLEKIVLEYARVRPDVLLQVDGLADQTLQALGLNIKLGRTEAPSPSVLTLPIWRETLLVVGPAGASLKDLRGMTYVEAARQAQVRESIGRVLAEFALVPDRTIAVWPAADSLRLLDRGAYAVLPYSLLAALGALDKHAVFASQKVRVPLDLHVNRASMKRPEIKALIPVIQAVTQEFMARDCSGHLSDPRAA